MVIITLTTKLDKLKNFASDLYAKACKHDGVDPGAPFIVFTPDNPYLEDYDLAIARIRRIQRSK